MPWTERNELLAEAVLVGIWPVRYSCLQYFTDRELRALIEAEAVDYPGGTMTEKRKAARPGPKPVTDRASVKLDLPEASPQRLVMWLIDKDWTKGKPHIESYVQMASWQPLPKAEGEKREYREFQSLGIFTDIAAAERMADFFEPWMNKLLEDGKITGGRIMTCDVGDEAKVLAMSDEEYNEYAGIEGEQQEIQDEE